MNVSTYTAKQNSTNPIFIKSIENLTHGAPREAFYVENNTSTKPHIIFPEFSENIKKIYSFLDLSQNWDGYGARPFKVELIKKTHEIISELNVQPDLFPTGRESIQLEYEKSNGDYLEFEIFLDRIALLRVVGDIEEEKNIEKQEISNFVDNFVY